MEYGEIQGVNKRVSRIVLGTMIISDQEEPSTKGGWSHPGRKACFELLDAVVAQGCTAFDTAHVYGVAGASELGLGLWVQERGNREQVVIISKGSTRSSPPAPYVVMPSFIDADIYESLGRLRTDYIDVYMPHRDDPRHPVGPFVETLNAHLAAGRIRAYGGSNWTHTRIAEANEYASKKGLVPFAVSEPHYSLAEQVVKPHGPGCVSVSGPDNKEARAWYASTRLPVIPYSSLGAGFFSGRLTCANFEQIKHELLGYCVTGYCHQVNFQRLERTMVLAQEKGASVPQIALAFILQSPLNVFALTGSRSGAEYADSAGALNVKLTPEERAWLDLETDERQ